MDTFQFWTLKLALASLDVVVYKVLICNDSPRCRQDKRHSERYWQKEEKKWKKDEKWRRKRRTKNNTKIMKSNFVCKSTSLYVEDWVLVFICASFMHFCVWWKKKIISNWWQQHHHHYGLIHRLLVKFLSLINIQHSNERRMKSRIKNAHFNVDVSLYIDFPIAMSVYFLLSTIRHSRCIH